MSERQVFGNSNTPFPDKEYEAMYNAQKMAPAKIGTGFGTANNNIMTNPE